MYSAKKIGTAIVLMQLHSNRLFYDCAIVSSFQSIYVLRVLASQALGLE